MPNANKRTLDWSQLPNEFPEMPKAKKRTLDLDWLELPSDVLEMIASRLLMNNLADYIRFRDVCKSWQSVSLTKPRSLAPQIPWLLLRSENETESRFCFYSVFKNQFNVVETPNCRERFCCGTSQGWLLMNDEINPTSLLINPITQAQFQLPPVTALPMVIENPPDNDCYALKMTSERHWFPNKSKYPNLIATTFVKRVALSSHPTLENIGNCVIMVISDGFHGLVFCKPGDTSWTVVKDKDYCVYNDIAYWNGHFYVVDKGGRVVVCDLVTCIAKEISSPKPLIDNMMYAYNLVESSGELRLIRRNLEAFRLQQNDVACFQVFKRDRIREEWHEIEKLGNHTLFLSSKSSYSVLSSDYPGLRGNCVYYIHPQPYDKCGIYNMEDGTFNEFYARNTDNYSQMFQDVWITPSVW